MLPKTWYAHSALKWLVLVNFINLLVLYARDVASSHPIWNMNNLTLLSLTGLFLISCLLIVSGWRVSVNPALMKSGLDLDLVVFCYLLLVDFNLIVTPGILTIALIVSIVGVPEAYVPRNNLIGVRIPLTFASDENWRKTNVFGARLLTAMSYLTLLFFGRANQALFFIVFLTLLILSTLVVFGYSYRLSRKLL
ncbi:membrane protein [Lactiplantibacillus plantarum EGD-AQ4]|nr:membrane protein [Lactiplantibacillus plantarum EGD-AQ4]